MAMEGHRRGAERSAWACGSGGARGVALRRRRRATVTPSGARLDAVCCAKDSGGAPRCSHRVGGDYLVLDVVVVAMGPVALQEK
ncbi:hypothetical protein ACP4OV_024401 [Aristida adscensionis]